MAGADVAAEAKADAALAASAAEAAAGFQQAAAAGVAAALAGDEVMTAAEVEAQDRQIRELFHGGAPPRAPT